MINNNESNRDNNREIRPSPTIQNQDKHIVNLIIDIIECTKDGITEIDIGSTSVVYGVDQGDVYIFGRKIDDFPNDGKTVKTLGSEIIENYGEFIAEIIMEEEGLSGIKNIIKFMGNHEDFYCLSDFPLSSNKTTLN